MNKKLIPLSISLLLGVALMSCTSGHNETKNEDASATAQLSDSQSVNQSSTTNDTQQVCPRMENAETIDMKDMQFTYAKYQDHICGILQVKLESNKEWSTKGSGWFAAGFGAKTMKGSNMFIFVPKTLDPKDTQYSVYSNVGGGGGSTLALNTKPQAGTIDILSSSLGKVEFALYPNKIDNLKSTGTIDMIFSHSRAAIDKFVPGHIAVYDKKTIQL